MGKEANSNIDRKSLYLDGTMGLVVGDALGVPVEFSSREEREQDPVKEMRGYGTYPVAKGSWSDDSSMALASLKALQDYLVDVIMTWIQKEIERQEHKI